MFAQKNLPCLIYVGTGSGTTCTSYIAEASVYGKRDGYITGLSVISKESQRSSLFRNTPGWKTGCVHDVEMLSRSAMYKPSASSLKYFKLTLTTPLILHILPFFDVEVTSQLPHMGRAFTDVQELKQAYTSALWLMFLVGALVLK